MTLIDVNRSLETEDLCRELLKRLRWPFGVRCLRCKSHAVFELATQKKFECSECHYQFSITTQTIFHDTHLPLETWFLAVLLLLEARKRMSAKQVQRTLRVSYKTAWISVIGFEEQLHGRIARCFIERFRCRILTSVERLAANVVRQRWETTRLDS